SPSLVRRGAIAIGVGALLAAAAAGPLLRPWWRERALAGAPRPTSVLLVTLDTTRADRLGCYGHTGAASPHLGALAARGVLFREAYAHVPLTCPSHSSLLTGRLPPHHGVRDNGGYVLAPAGPPLAERFPAARPPPGAAAAPAAAPCSPPACPRWPSASRPPATARARS